MKGSMRQRGLSWELKVYLGVDPVTGKERYATKKVRGGRREAQRVLNEMVVEAERGLSARTNATVGELLDRWLELARVDFSPKTTRETAGYIERNLRPALPSLIGWRRRSSADYPRAVGAGSLSRADRTGYPHQARTRTGSKTSSPKRPSVF